ncbi:MAG: hypothetical protein JWO91_1996 [Acidobacteriaceae bacterium]|nr:hypothetical protein [Acidobacteriaceae bacterium]
MPRNIGGSVTVINEGGIGDAHLRNRHGYTSEVVVIQVEEAVPAIHFVGATRHFRPCLEHSRTVPITSDDITAGTGQSEFGPC